ncbi:MAG: hypothetical protein AB1346_06415 [Thermodesulfobacteriota bacterium]
MMIRNAYLKKIEKRLRALDEEIEYLGKKAFDLSADARVEISRQVDSLKEKTDVARDRIRDVREAGVETWGRLKTHAESAVDDVRKGLDEAVRKLRKTGSGSADR